MSPPPVAPGRHFLARLRPGARLAHPGPPRRDAAALDAWLRAGFPAVVRRADEGASPGSLALGVLLPPEGEGRGRPVAFRVARGDVLRLSPPIPLAEVAARAEGVWARGLAELLRAEGIGGAGVYGSHMWQAVTGRRYVRDGSDIDLHIPVAGRRAAAEIGEGLLAWEGRTGLGADGEFVFPGGAAVSWREYHSGKGREVLVKTLGAVRLAPREELADALPR